MNGRRFWNLIAMVGMVLMAACAGQPVQEQAAPVNQAAATATAEAEVPITAAETQSAAGTQPAAMTQPAAPTDTQAITPAPTVPATIDCASPAALTPAMTEGPYFTPGSPETKDLAGDLPGKKLRLSGYVLTTDCQPVANAKIDFWQADAQGQYDNNGYTLRGHQFTDANGRYELVTVVPGEYPGRTEHIHLKVQAPGGPELTTQLFFPGVAQNEGDRIFDEILLVKVVEDKGEMVATYDFVVEQ